MANTGAVEIEAKKSVESIISMSPNIATMPEVTVKIIDIVENPKSKMQDLNDVIRNDAALTSRILKVVNSAIYSLPTQVGNIDRAIVLLGLSAVKNIAIATSMTHLFTGKTEMGGFSLIEVWRHSVAMGVGAKLVYSARNCAGGDEAFLAGLIADLGLLIERQSVESLLAQVIRKYADHGGDFCALEREIIGADHQQFGRAITKKWRFPETLCNTNGNHHDPLSLPKSDRELPLVVHVADVLACRLQVGFCTMSADQEIDPAVMTELGMTNEMLDSVSAQMPEQIKVAEAIFEPA
jgi:HD-like signal output (HDOD) protein